MRLLFLSQGKKINDHPGWNYSLERLKEECFISDFTNIPYFGYAEKHGWNDFYDEVVRLCKTEKYDVVYFHYFHSSKIPSPKHCLEAIKNLNNRPVILTSSGDAFSDNWMMKQYPMSFKVASCYADITFSTQMGKAADRMISWGAKRVVLAPNSMCPVRFKAHSIVNQLHEFKHDVVFVGSHNRKYMNPLSQHWYRSLDRNKLVKSLVDNFREGIGLYGKGWSYSEAQGPIPFNEQQNYFKKGRVVVGGNPYSFSDYYTSNRVFFEVSSGVPVVEVLTNRFDNILRKNDHCYYVSSIDDVLEKCKDLLSSDPQKLYKKAAIAAKYIEEKHTQYHRMKFKLNTVKRYIENNKKLDVEFPFFLPEIDLKEEMKYAIREASNYKLNYE